MTCTTKEYYGLYYSKDYFMLKLYPVLADNTPEFGFMYLRQVMIMLIMNL